MRGPGAVERWTHIPGTKIIALCDLLPERVEKAQEILKEKGINVRELIAKQNIFVRWTLYYLLIIAIVIFGAYGFGYAPVDPIYANF